MALESCQSGVQVTRQDLELPTSVLEHGRNMLKEAFCPECTAQTLRAAARGGKGDWGGGMYLKIFLRRGDICSCFFMAELRESSQGWGRREQQCHKSPSSSFPGSECSYERRSRFVKPGLIVQKFDLGRKT